MIEKTTEEMLINEFYSTDDINENDLLRLKNNPNKTCKLSTNTVKLLNKSLTTFQGVLIVDSEVPLEVIEEFDFSKFKGTILLEDKYRSLEELFTACKERVNNSQLSKPNFNKSTLIDLFYDILKNLNIYEAKADVNEILYKKLKSFEGRFFLADDKMTLTALSLLPKSFKGCLHLGNNVTKNTIEILSQIVPYFTGKLQIDSDLPIESAKALNLNDYRGTLVLSGNFSDKLNQIINEKLKKFNGTLYLLDNTKLNLSLSSFNGYLYLGDNVTKDTIGDINKKLTSFKGKVALDKTIQPEITQELTLKHFQGTILGLNECSEEIIKIIEEKLETFTGELYFADDIITNRTLSLSLKPFKGTLYINEKLAIHKIDLLNKTLKTFTGILKLNCSDAPEILKALNLSQFRGTIQLDGQFSEELNVTINEKLKSFKGNLPLYNELLLTGKQLRLPLKNFTGRLLCIGEHLSKDTFEILSNELNVFNGELWLDKTLKINVLKKLNLTKFKGTLFLDNLEIDAVKILNDKLEKFQSSVCFGEKTKPELLMALTSKFFNQRKILIDGFLSTSAMLVLVDKVKKGKGSLYDMDGNDLLEELKKYSQKKEHFVECINTPQPLSTISNESKEKKKKKTTFEKESKTDIKTRHIRERIRIRKEEKEREKETPFDVKKETNEEDLSTKNKIHENQGIMTNKSKEILCIGNGIEKIQEFSSHELFKGEISFFSKKESEQISPKILPHNLDLKNLKQYESILKRTKVQDVKSPLLNLIEEKNITNIKLKERKKCPIELLEAINYLNNDFGMMTSNEFDRIYLLGRAIQTIKQILESKEWESLKKRCIDLGKLRNLLVHYGLSSPIRIITMTIKELYKISQDPNEFFYDLSKSQCFEDLTTLALVYQNDYLYKLEIKSFLEHSINLIKLIQISYTEKLSDEHNISLDVIKFSLCFLGELSNHSPSDLNLFYSYKNYKLISEFLLKCKKIVRNIEFHETVDNSEYQEIILNPMFSSTRTLLCNQVAPESITQILKKCNQVLDLMEMKLEEILVEKNNFNSLIN